MTMKFFALTFLLLAASEAQVFRGFRGDSDPCLICGESNQVVSNAESLLPIPQEIKGIFVDEAGLSLADVTCEHAFLLGINGWVPQDICQLGTMLLALMQQIKDTCGCVTAPANAAPLETVPTETVADLALEFPDVNSLFDDETINSMQTIIAAWFNAYYNAATIESPEVTNMLSSVEFTWQGIHNSWNKHQKMNVMKVQAIYTHTVSYQARPGTWAATKHDPAGFVARWPYRDSAAVADLTQRLRSAHPEAMANLPIDKLVVMKLPADQLIPREGADFFSHDASKKFAGFQGPHESCHICRGDATMSVTNKDTKLPVPVEYQSLIVGQQDVMQVVDPTCQVAFNMGVFGWVPEDLCAAGHALPQVMDDIANVCGCQVVPLSPPTYDTVTNAVVNGVSLVLKNVPSFSVGSVALFETTLASWFQSYYDSDGQDEIKSLTTTIKYVSHEMENGSVKINYSQTLSYMVDTDSWGAGEQGRTGLITPWPFRDPEVNANLVLLLKTNIPELSTLSRIPVPLVDGSSYIPEHDSDYWNGIDQDEPVVVNTSSKFEDFSGPYESCWICNEVDTTVTNGVVQLPIPTEYQDIFVQQTGVSLKQATCDYAHQLGRYGWVPPEVCGFAQNMPAFSSSVQETCGCVKATNSMKAYSTVPRRTATGLTMTLRGLAGNPDYHVSDDFERTVAAWFTSYFSGDSATAEVRNMSTSVHVEKIARRSDSISIVYTQTLAYEATENSWASAKYDSHGLVARWPFRDTKANEALVEALKSANPFFANVFGSIDIPEFAVGAHIPKEGEDYVGDITVPIVEESEEDSGLPGFVWALIALGLIAVGFAAGIYRVKKATVVHEKSDESTLGDNVDEETSFAGTIQ